MFTSRAEFRLQLREDNADARLTGLGRQLGLVDDARWAAFCRKQEAVSRETQRLRSTWVNPQNLPASEAERVLGKALEHEHNLADLLGRPGVRYADLMGLNRGQFASAALAPPTSSEEDEAAWRLTVVEQLEIAAKYSGYIQRQKDEVLRAAHYEHLKLPADLNYLQVPGLGIEAKQKLQQHKPETLGQASRLSGITPATVSLLLVHLKKSRHKAFANTDAQPSLGESGV
jgi:tRNA uridine 5-carboxymethylaminomethyl modification enzyme